MGLFALPVPAYQLGQHARKRRRHEAEEVETSPEAEDSHSRLSSISANPRSYSPDTLQQLAVAGLSADEELPSVAHPLFPHKPLPLEYSGRPGRRGRPAAKSTATPSAVDSGADTDDPDRSSADALKLTSNSARLKHLNNMMAILHRSLHEGDVARAKRAFSLLVQTKEIDLRHGYLWTLGSEILMRDGEAPVSQGSEPHRHEPLFSLGNDDGIPNRWGLAANVEKVKRYLETLVQQYPYDIHRPRHTSAVDFWPVLYSIEIYNLDAECQRALRRLDRDFDEESTAGLEPIDYEEDQDEQRQRDNDHEQQHWAAKDEIRQDTHAAGEQIAARMDLLMEQAPYGTNHEMLRLRGMLALFIGDLCLPSSLLARNELHQGQLRGGGLLRLNAQTEVERASLLKQNAEYNKGRAFLRTLLAGGGDLGGRLRKFAEDEAEDDSLSVASSQT